MNWQQFKEDTRWREIEALLTARVEIITAELTESAKTPTLPHARVLQQELQDMMFMLILPDRLAANPEPKIESEESEDGELETDS